MVILLVCHGICLTQNDSKEFRQQAVLPFQRSQSRESGTKGEKDVNASRGTVGVRCTYKRVPTFYAFQSQIATRADIFFFSFFFFFFFTRVTDFAKKKALLLSWVEFCGSSIVSFLCRVQEQLLFQRLMACHSLPKERLDHPVILNERYTCTFIHVFCFFFFLTLNRSTFNKVSMYPGLFWF